MLDLAHPPLTLSGGAIREATGAWTPDGEQGWHVNSGGVVAIHVYLENGQAAPVPYLRIVYDDGTEVRTAAHHYDVHLAAPYD